MNPKYIYRRIGRFEFRNSVLNYHQNPNTCLETEAKKGKLSEDKVTNPPPVDLFWTERKNSIVGLRLIAFLSGAFTSFIGRYRYDGDNSAIQGPLDILM